MRKLLIPAIVAVIFNCNVNAQSKKVEPKELIIKVDSAHANYLFALWQAGTVYKYDELMKTNTPAFVVNDFRRWADSVFSANTEKYNSWFPKPEPPKNHSDTTTKKP